MAEEGFIVAYAVGLTDGQDHGAHRYRITCSDPEALEAWKKRIQPSLINEYRNRWFTFDFWSFENIFTSWLDVGKEFYGRVFIEILPNPLVTDPKRHRQEKLTVPKPKKKVKRGNEE